MSHDTTLFAAPECDPGSKSGEQEAPTEVLEGSIQPEPRQTEGAVGDGEANPEPLQPTSDKHIEENATVSNATVSARKLAANRQNAIHSCGPKTERGKANSSKNAIKHGIFAGKLFSQTEGERLEFQELAAQLVEHYQPFGFKEQLLVEQILTELIRNSRILRYEQRVLSEDAAFFTGHSLEKVLRYSTFHGRQLSQLLEQLEDEQSKRQS